MQVLRPVPIAALAALTLLAGCGREEVQRSFGLTRSAPDEFVVTTRAPLSVPPDFALRPPQPGAARPQEQTTTNAAEDALVPQAALTAAPAAASAADSPGQEAIIAAAGPTPPADIRRRVDQEAAKEASSHALTDRLMFWKTPAPPGTVVDPQKEAQRLRNNAALGQSQTTGDTPIVQTPPKSLFNELF